MSPSGPSDSPANEAMASAMPAPARATVPDLVIATPDPRALLGDWPALGRRLAAADHRREDFLAVDDWLLAMHQVPTDAEPALAAVALGLTGRGHGWLRLDAVSLTVSGDRLVALPPAPGDLTDAATLIDALLPQLPRLGAPHAHGTQRLLDLDAPAQARFAPLWRTANRPLDDHLPQGPRGAEWRRWLTEAQMLLHEHPLNANREARGLRPLNALWLAGGAAHAPAPRDCDLRLLGAHPLAATLRIGEGRHGTSSDGTAALTVWLHQPGASPPETAVTSLAGAAFDLRILEPSGQQCYRRRLWHTFRIWRKPLHTLSPIGT